MIDFACVSSTTPTWSNYPRLYTPGIAATEAEHGKLASDRASSAPVQGVHRYYPFVVEDRGRLGKSALTVVYIFAVLLAVRNFPGGPSAPTSCFLRGQSVQALRNFVARQHAEFRRHLSRTRRGLLQRVSACVHGTLGGILFADSDSDFSKYDCVMPLVVLEASKANASPEAVGQPLSRKNEPDERVHGNTGRRGQKSRNEKRDWTEGLWRKRGYTNKTFKVTARRFWQMAKETAPPLEFDDLASPLTVDGSA
eukprot:jgi/Tetstr1/455004/TSEL_041862.t1